MSATVTSSLTHGLRRGDWVDVTGRADILGFEVKPGGAERRQTYYVTKSTATTMTVRLPRWHERLWRWWLRVALPAVRSWNPCNGETAEEARAWPRR